jgi:uncharacterized protein
LVAGAMGFACACGAGTDPAKELKRAQSLLSDGNYDQAYPLYLEFAKKGNPLAQFTLGMFHQLGWGKRPVDPEQACSWYEKAAHKDIPTSAHLLAGCIEQGIGRPADPTEAANWYRRAADLGHYYSLCSLAELYMQGLGVEKDPVKGLALCRQAAEKGAIPASVQLGKYLLNGDPAIRDPEAAHAWFEAVANVSPEAQYYLGVIHRDGLGHPKTPDEARLWFERAASRGYLPAYFQTGKLYFQVSPDYKQQKPPADFLAKAYLWLSATLKRSQHFAEKEQAKAMLQEVLGIMPASWKPTLDQQVVEHLAKFPAAP